VSRKSEQPRGFGSDIEYRASVNAIPEEAGPPERSNPMRLTISSTTGHKTPVSMLSVQWRTNIHTDSKIKRQSSTAAFGRGISSWGNHCTWHRPLVNIHRLLWDVFSTSVLALRKPGYVHSILERPVSRFVSHCGPEGIRSVVSETGSRGQFAHSAT
jgi:hypothetical protein